MNRTLISLTRRQLLGRNRTIVIAVVAMAIPIVIAILARNSDTSTPSDELAIGLVSSLILTGLLPVVALVLGTASLGAEIEDGTAVFLLSKPIERWRIVLIKMGVAAVAVCLLIVPPTMAMAWIIHGGPTADGLVLGLGLSATAAIVLYTVVFVALSARTSRALIVGLVYVFVWEGLVTNIFNGLRWLSIREYAVGWGDAFITIDDASVFDPRLSVVAAAIASVVVIAGGFALGTRALAEFEIGERA